MNPELKMTKEDEAILVRAAAAGGVANTQSAATARVVLAHENLLWQSGGAPAKGGSDAGVAERVEALEQKLGKAAPGADLVERIAALEAAFAKVELPDVAYLEGTIGELKARLGALEEALGATPDAEPPPADEDAKATKKRGR